jgi:hypothetical protein
LLVSQSACTPVRTFEVLVKTVGCFEWTRNLIECNRTGAMQYLKRAVEERLGILPAMQEFYLVDITQRNEEEQMEVALKHDHVFERDCSLVVAVDPMYNVVIEGAVEAGRDALMGVYVRIADKEVLGHGPRGVAALGVAGRFYVSQPKGELGHHQRATKHGARLA